MGKYSCIIYTKDSRRIERVIYLKPENFGFSKETKIENFVEESNDEVLINQKLPTVEIISINSGSNLTVREFHCQTGLLSLQVLLF
jgi:hypothetical protein